ncbi:MAG: hypothetical protein OZSIB_0693 [Candidatus Ozemobacter sibiricus]|uniref:Type IV fimbrial biogenesis protein PilV n=1 Tax=Candidatus Ozemobacter sibiricus TaxID=2268124 RepID=A0A367ZV14_9BACT|nr:MAG: hypothetical protein OZSIB_0693 [Candidatus Ozemobacter sibiricus]
MRRAPLGLAGVSLVEILIGLILLALVMIPSLTVILSDTKAVTGTRDHTMAAFVAQNLLETARNYKFAYLDADQYAGKPDIQQTTFEYALTHQLKEKTVNGIKYEVKDARIDPVKNTLAPDEPPILVLVKFAIEYTGADGRNHRLDISTAIAQEE